MITFDLDTSDIRDLIAVLKVVPGQMEIASSRSINKALTRTRTEMVRLVRSEYAVKAGTVRKELAILRATPRDLVGRIKGESSPGIPLKEFARTKKVPSTKRTKGFVQTKAGYMTRGYLPKVGIPVLVRKDKGKLPASGVFLARMKSGHIGAFKRTTAGTGNWWATNHGQGIREVYGPSPIKILSSDRYDEQVDDFAGNVMEEELIRQADVLLRKAGLR